MATATATKTTRVKITIKTVMARDHGKGTIRMKGETREGHQTIIKREADGNLESLWLEEELVSFAGV